MWAGVMMKADWGESTVVVNRYRSFRRVYFIDAGVDDSSQLLAQMQPGDIGVRLPYGARALDTMVEYMATHPQPDAVALIAHGEPGAFQLGGQHINTQALMRDQSLWLRIGQYLGHRGSLALFSCRLAQGEKGQQFLKQLARISGIAHIAASARTLSPQKGWWLNIRHGVPSQDVDVMVSRFSHYPHALASTDIHFTFDKASIEGKTAVETHDGLTMRVTAPGIPSVSFKGGMFAMEAAKAKNSLIEVQFDQPVVLNDLFIRVIRLKDGSYGGTTFLYQTDAGEDKTSFYKTSSSHKRASFDQPFQTLTMEQVNPNFENSEYGIRWLLDYLKVTPVPQFESARYDADSGILTVEGRYFASQSNGDDIDASKITLVGQGGKSYTLTKASSGELSSDQQFSLQLSSADQAALTALMNQNGVAAFDDSAYQLHFAEGFNTPLPKVSISAPSTSSPVTVSGISPVDVTEAAYNMESGTLTISGRGFAVDPNADDIDAQSITLIGTGGERYTLSDTADVELMSEQRFQLSLSDQDQQALRAIWDQSGTQAHDATAYQVELSTGFMTARPGASGTSSVTVGQVPVADMVEVNYSTASGLLTVTGHDFMAQADGSDINVSYLTITGANGRAYTLSDSSDVALTDPQHFSVQLSDQDRAAVSRLLNENGLKAFDGTPYQLSAGAGFMPVRDWISDAAVNTFEVTDVAPVVFSGFHYDMATGLLSVDGSGFVADMSAADIDTSLLALVGAGGERYTLTDTADVELMSDQRFQLSLSDQDQQALRDLFDRSGDSAFDDTAYQIEWQQGVILARPGTSGKASLEAVNVPQPAIESARYDVKTGQLDVVGSGFLHVDDQLDVDASKITLVGDNGHDFTLMNTSDVNIKSSTSFTLTLSASDQKEVIAFLNQNGTVAQDSTAYSVKAASGFMVARDQVADVANNRLTVFNIADPDSQPTPDTTPDPQPTPGIDSGPAPRPDPDTNPNPHPTPGTDPDPAPRPDPEPQPNDGDNGDNIPDVEQASVTSLVFLETPMPISQPNNAPATYVSLSTDEGNMLQDVMQQDALHDLPTSMKMPMGMLTFKAVVLTGQVANFQLVVNDDLGVDGYWKQDAQGEWVNLASEAMGGDMVKFDDHLMLTFSIMDGGEFDGDGEANGQIVDLGAPGRWVEPPMPFDETHHGHDHFDWFTLTD
ncbi:hypothetical protein BFW38_00225 [Terasakiispira papahanaumokuakeensis]|uniref:DUF4347 domain-containing protein n=2 Tax=Terasakiispira papahanaumokuakeensis TaxID=197479 RepID=A0A1E2V5D0_9GAMM|nr:hypothetical protein BFW38_00225 [Terasakiispira papahanaumokuakeensis]